MNPDPQFGAGFAVTNMASPQCDGGVSVLVPENLRRKCVAGLLRAGTGPAIAWSDWCPGLAESGVIGRQK